MKYFLIEDDRDTDDPFVWGPYKTVIEARKHVSKYLEELLEDMDEPDYCRCLILSAVERHSWKKPKLPKDITVENISKCEARGKKK